MRNLITFMVAGLLAFILLVSCGTEPGKDEIAVSVDAQVSEATLKDTPALSDTDKHAPTKASIPFYPNGDMAKVVRVVDGDTIEVNMDGVNYPVRYIGMDTPERGDFYFNEAMQANAAMVEGQTVILVKDVSETDRYHRLLRYVYLKDGTFVNAELVRLGFAQIATYPPDIAHQDEYLRLQQEAREASAGLWEQSTDPLISQPTNPATPLQPPAKNCDPHYPTVCIASYPPDLDCGQISFRRFQVLQPDPHGFDMDKDGIGCEND